MRYRWGILAATLILGVALAACTLGAEDEKSTPEPTRSTPIAADATQSTETDTPEPTETNPPEATDTNTPEATDTNTPAATDTAEPTATPHNTNTPTSTATITPPPSLTPSINRTVTASPESAATSIASVPTVTALPTNTSIPPSATPGRTFAPPPTFTPAIWASSTPVSPSAPTPIPQATLAVPTQENVVGGAKVCGTCDNLRLRATPGTAGNVVTYLAANTSVTIIGRTEDNVWVQITLDTGMMGWVSAQYLDIGIELSAVPITGEAEDTAYPTSVPIEGPGGVNVVSGISSHARQIFLDGRAKGNSAHTFTRVGDSITASPFFLTGIGSNSYSLSAEYAYLGGAINFFSGPNGRGVNPFGAASVTANNGWSTVSVLNPAQASSICRSGETPLECEYRIVKPAVALVMLGTNDSGGLPTADYTANLHRIVEISINMGVIPVLSTIPPKHYDPNTDGRVAEFNQIIVATARAYDVPLWDYFSVMRPLPSEGLSSDGVHPSIPPSGTSVVLDANNLKYGYAMRNLTALQVLYALWQQVLYDGDNAPPATSAPIVYPTAAPGGSGDDGGTDNNSGSNPGDCTGTSSPRLTVGGQGRVTPGDPNKVRSAPTLAGAQVGSIPGEGVFSVIGGPQCADGFLWWQVNYQGLTGWTANGDGTEYWVEPYP